MNKLLEIYDVVELWKATEPYRFSFTTGQRQAIKTEFESLIEDDNINPQYIKHYIYESLWRHYGINAYGVGYNAFSLNCKWKHIAERIAERLRKANMSVEVDHNDILHNVRIISYTSLSVPKITYLVHDVISSICETSAIKIQKIFRKWNAKRKTHAATLIQSCFRGWIIRKNIAWNPHCDFGYWNISRQMRKSM